MDIASATTELLTLRALSLAKLSVIAMVADACPFYLKPQIS